MLGDSRAPKSALNLRGASDLAIDDRWARPSASMALRALVVAAVLALVLAAALYEVLPGSHPRLAPAAAPRSVPHMALTSLPLPLQGPVSQALGGAAKAYRVSAATASGSPLVAASPAQHLRLRFGSAGISIRAGATHVGLSLRAA